MKHFALVIGSVALLLAACGNNDSPGDALVGNWVWDGDAEQGTGTMYMSFLDNGRYLTGAYEGFDDGFTEGVYEASGDSIVLQPERSVMRPQQWQEPNFVIAPGEYPSWVEPGKYNREDLENIQTSIFRFAYEGDEFILAPVGDEEYKMRHRRLE